MSSAVPPIDIGTTPELARLAEEVRASMQPRMLQRDGETIAVVMPVASEHVDERASTRADKEVDAIARTEARQRLFAPVSEAELAKRQTLVQAILVNRERRVISPLTTADLVHQVREEEYRSYDDRR